jgi:hypothetical protein
VCWPDLAFGAARRRPLLRTTEQQPAGQHRDRYKLRQLLGLGLELVELVEEDLLGDQTDAKFAGGANCCGRGGLELLARRPGRDQPNLADRHP